MGETMAISSQSDASAAAQIRGAVIKRRAEWRADTLFAELVAVEAEDPALKRKAAEIFETDVAAEFDARHLSARLAVYMADWP